jgi:hypothetical protein
VKRIAWVPVVWRSDDQWDMSVFDRDAHSYVDSLDEGPRPSTHPDDYDTGDPPESES